ncbi:MAG: hypothetical protein AAB557_05545 [Patescibacteria group bacterium]
MEEQGSEMEKIAETEALKHEIGEARTQIEQDMKDPAQSTADAAGEVGIVKEMWDVMGKHGKTFGEITWKNVKAFAAGGLSLVPLVGEMGTLAKFGGAAKAGKAYTNVRGLDNAARKIGESSWVVERALQKGKLVDAIKNIPQNPMRLVANPIKSAKDVWGARKDLQEARGYTNIVKQLGEDKLLDATDRRVGEVVTKKMSEAQGAYSGAKKQLGKDVLISGGLHLMHKIDPYPDVPQTLAMVAGLAEFVLPGANIVPALWQFAHNQNEWGITARNLALDMGKVVMKRFDGKINEVKKPDVVQAAAVFVPVGQV